VKFVERRDSLGHVYSQLLLRRFLHEANNQNRSATVKRKTFKTGIAVMNHNTRPRLPPSVSLACEPPAPVLYWQQATGAPHGPWPSVMQVCFVLDLQHVLVLAGVTLVLWNV